MNEPTHDAERSRLPRVRVYRTAYTPGTLREKRFGRGPRLPSEHPAARYRDIDRLKREDAVALGESAERGELAMVR